MPVFCAHNLLELYGSILKYKFDPNLKSPILQHSTLTPRTSSNETFSIFVTLQDTAKKQILRKYFNKQFQVWISLDTIDLPFNGSVRSFASTDSSYIIFGYKGKFVSVDKLSLSITSHPEMITPRTNFASIVNNDYVYVLGGCCRNIFTKCYDIALSEVDRYLNSYL